MHALPRVILLPHSCPDMLVPRVPVHLPAPAPAPWVLMPLSRPAASHPCSQAIDYAAQHFQQVVQQDLAGFCSLSTACLVDILCSECLVSGWDGDGVGGWRCVDVGWAGGQASGWLDSSRITAPLLLISLLSFCVSLSLLICTPSLQDCPEKAVFDAAMKWAGYGSEVEDGASACHPMQVSIARLGCTWEGAKGSSAYRGFSVAMELLCSVHGLGFPGSLAAVLLLKYACLLFCWVQDLDQLLPCIRFPLMSDSELELVR